ncbi:MAG TPA: transposase, partial [Acetobacteraceae bacterium]|nr:transposase [Acetobacteraceae bacterium]
MTDLSSPEFHDETKAREWLELARWPTGAYCPHCGSFDVFRMEGQPERRQRG